MGCTINYVLDLWNQIEQALNPILAHFDPSQLQNIVLGILAIFIPFAIVFLTNLLGGKENRTEFQKMVLTEEILGTTKVFWISVIGIMVFPFFSGTEVSFAGKLVALFVAVILVALLWTPFKKTLRYSEGYSSEFELSFMRKLKLPEILRFREKPMMVRIIRAWGSFWSQPPQYNEREVVKIYIDHIESGLRRKKYDFVVELSDTLDRNLDKRDRFVIAYEVFPKVLEWSESFWSTEQKWLTRKRKEEALLAALSNRYLGWIKSFAGAILKKYYVNDGYFWNFHYFEQKMFPQSVKILLHSGHSVYELFSVLKKHVDSVESKLESDIKSDPDADIVQRRFNYLRSLMGSFYPVFFNEIYSASDKYSIWEHYYPPEWKITHGNAKNRITRIVLHEFLEWSQRRLFKDASATYDKDLTEVVEGLFPSVHHLMFPAFLTLLFTSDIKTAIKKEPSFFLINTSISWSGELSEAEVQKMFQEQDQAQINETVDVILDYFKDSWNKLRLFREDLTEEEHLNWKDKPEEEKSVIANRIRISKLREMLEELGSPELLEMAKESERYEHNRATFIALLQLLADRLTRGGAQDQVISENTTSASHTASQTD